MRVRVRPKPWHHSPGPLVSVGLSEAHLIRVRAGVRVRVRVEVRARIRVRVRATVGSRKPTDSYKGRSASAACR